MSGSQPSLAMYMLLNGQAFLHGIISPFPFCAQFPVAQWLGNSAFHSQMSLPPSHSCEFPPYPCSQQCHLGLHSSHFGACLHRSFFLLELEWEASKMLPQSSKKLSRKSWRPHKMLPGPAFSHYFPLMARTCGYLLFSLPVAKEFSAKLLRTVLKSVAYFQCELLKNE